MWPMKLANSVGESASSVADRGTRAIPESSLQRGPRHMVGRPKIPTPVVTSVRRPGPVGRAARGRERYSADVTARRYSAGLRPAQCLQQPPRQRRIARTTRAGTDEETQMADVPEPHEGIVLTHFIVSEDIPRSRAFYAG